MASARSCVGASRGVRSFFSFEASTPAESAALLVEFLELSRHRLRVIAGGLIGVMLALSDHHFTRFKRSTQPFSAQSIYSLRSSPSRAADVWSGGSYSLRLCRLHGKPLVQRYINFMRPDKPPPLVSAARQQTKDVFTDRDGERVALYRPVDRGEDQHAACLYEINASAQKTSTSATCSTTSIASTASNRSPARAKPSVVLQR